MADTRPELVANVTKASAIRDKPQSGIASIDPPVVGFDLSLRIPRKEHCATVSSSLRGALLILLGSVLFLTSCGGGNSSPPPPPPPSTITSVTVSPGTGQLRTGDTLPFKAAVKGTGPFNTAVTWLVDGIPGGDATHGTIAAGVYTAPLSVPNPDPVTITARSIQDSSKSGDATATVYSLVVSPANPNVPYGHTQQFTAQVIGLDNPTVEFVMASGSGRVTIDGFFTAPTVIFNPVEIDKITTTVLGGGSPVTTQITVTIPPPVLTSITPNGASAWETVTVDGEDLFGCWKIVFPGPNGLSRKVDLQEVASQLTAMIPLGAASGPVHLECTPIQGVSNTSNVIDFIRLPNLRVHAREKDLSSGEAMQLDWRLLGANTPSQVNWTADAGTINSNGLYQAPIVSAESFARVTGCVQDTRSCNTVLLRILPFRITPPTPVVDLGKTIQLDALQGGSFLTPEWSVLAGGGTITNGGLYTAPTAVPQAGEIPIAAKAGTTTEQTSVAVSGAFPGLVNRVYEYLDYSAGRTPEGSFVLSVAVNGNRAYSLSYGSPAEPQIAYTAIDVYDISDPDHPVWLDATEAINKQAASLFVSGNSLFELDSQQLAVFSLQSNVPAPISTIPISVPLFWSINNGVVYYITSVDTQKISVDVIDVHTGTAVRNHYDLPEPVDDPPIQAWGATGVDHYVYVSWLNPPPDSGFSVATYDISTSPPTLVDRMFAQYAFGLQAVDHLLFFDKAINGKASVYDISNVVPQYIKDLNAINAMGKQANRILVQGASANYYVLDATSPTNPTIQENVVDLLSTNIFYSPMATWETADRFITTGGPFGFTVYNVAAEGGPTQTNYVDNGFAQTFDQAVQQQTLYTVGEGVLGSTGGLTTLDVSSGLPVKAGALLYPNEAAYSLQVSGNTLFLGLAHSLKVVDVSNPASPGEIASLPIPTNALALSGNTLFVGTRDGRLVVLDVSNRNAPTTIASVNAVPPITMRLSGTLLFLAAGPAGMSIFDVSNRVAPVKLSQFVLHAQILDVAPMGSTVLVAAARFGLVTVDVSNPSQPKELSQTELLLADPAISVSFKDGLAYVGTALGMVMAFDVSKPVNPRMVGFNVVGPIGNSEILVITPSDNNLYLGVTVATLQPNALVQIDNALPRNSIEQYFPPSALAQPIGVDDEFRDVRSKADLVRSWRAAREHVKFKGPFKVWQHDPSVGCRAGHDKSGRAEGDSSSRDVWREILRRDMVCKLYRNQAGNQTRYK